MAIRMRLALRPDLGADLEELEADRAAGGSGEAGSGQRDAPQGAEQDIGHGGEPEAELVGAHGGGRCAVGEEVDLALLDPVFHLAAGAVEPFVERLAGRSTAGPSEVTTKRGLAPRGSHSALPTTRRRRDHVFRVR